MYLAWRSILEVGVPAIDDDHRHLVELLNRIQDASTDDDRWTLLGVLDELQTFLAAHFAREELMMVGLRYDGMESHRIEHQRLFDDVQRQIRALADGRIVAGAVSLYLQRWLLRHIEVADRQLGKAICQHRWRQAHAAPGGTGTVPTAIGRGAVPEAKRLVL